MEREKSQNVVTTLYPKVGETLHEREDVDSTLQYKKYKYKQSQRLDGNLYNGASRRDSYDSEKPWRIMHATSGGNGPLFGRVGNNFILELKREGTIYFRDCKQINLDLHPCNCRKATSPE